MSNSTNSIWMDEFSTPTIESLRGELPAASRSLFDQAKSIFMDLDEIEQGFAWHGDCWHWVITFSLADHDDELPLGIIIPSPEDLQVAIPMDREVIHVIPQEFIIDDQDGIREPLGMSGVRLEANIHIVTAAVTSAQNIVKCANKAGLNVIDIVLSCTQVHVVHRLEHRHNCITLNFECPLGVTALFGNKRYRRRNKRGVPQH